MNYRKIILVSTFIILAIISTALFWKQTIVLSCLLLVLAIIKHLFVPTQNELLKFLIAGLFGTIAESLIIFFGNNPWVYLKQDIFNVPLWIIPLWGLAGTILTTLYDVISKKH